MLPCELIPPNQVNFIHQWTLRWIPILLLCAIDMGIVTLLQHTKVISFGSVPRSWIVGSYSSSTFNFQEPVFHNGCADLHFHQEHPRGPLSLCFLYLFVNSLSSGFAFFWWLVKLGTSSRPCPCGFFVFLSFERKKMSFQVLCLFSAGVVFGTHNPTI